MTVRRAALLVALLAAFAPPAGHAAEVRVVARDVPLGSPAGGPRALAARPAPLPFHLVGLHWRGDGHVWFRTSRSGGAWSPWQPAQPEAEDLPDPGTAEAKASQGWHLGNPYWTGRADRIQYRLAGPVERLRAFFVRSPAEAAPAVAARVGRPGVIRRSQWGADESIVRAKPLVADRLRLALVHHTAGANSYSRSQSAAIVRGIQRYHVLSNGWNDIGYNFLVDKYGQVFEGRGGGIAENVVGAHAGGFNTGSVGVAVLGTYSGSRISKEGRSALVKLLAWRLDVGHVDPLSSFDYSSYGNERFAPGEVVRLRSVSGHRDTGQTTCPGTALYGQLPGIAKSVAARGLPKLYDPQVSGEVGGLVRFTARLSTSAPWTVTVKDASGLPVAQGGGTGKTVDWSWDASAAPVERYTYVIGAGSRFRPATGGVPGPPPLAVRGAEARPSALTPNGDGVGERMRISFRLTVRSTVRVTVLQSGSRVKMLIPDRLREAGPVSTWWNGSADDGSLLPDGAYRVRISAIAGTQKAVGYREVVVDRTLGSLTASRAALSPNEDGRGERVAFGYDLVRDAEVRVDVLDGREVVRKLFAGPAVAGRQAAAWDGRLRTGLPAPDGTYRVRVRATTTLGTRTLGRTLAVDTDRPGLRLVWARFARGATRIRLVLDEPARLRIRYGEAGGETRHVVVLEREAGDQKVRRPIEASVIRIRAQDGARNRSRTIVAAVR